MDKILDIFNEHFNTKYIYFIEGFDKEKKMEIKYQQELIKPFKTLELEDNKNINCLVYRFDKKKINLKDQDFKNVKMKLILEDSEEGNFEFLIEKIYPDDDLFIFDLQFKRNTFFFQKLPSGQYSLPHRRQYEIYRALFKEEDKDQISNLVEYAKPMILNAKSYEFSFFINIFSDIVYIKDLFDYSLLFNMKKISGIGIVDDVSLRIAKSLINQNYDNPFEKMIKSKDKKEQEKQLNKIALFLFFFNYQYQEEKIINLLENPHYNIYIYKNLLNIDKKYMKYSIPKKCINKLITFANNYDELLTIISYNKNCLEILEIINENHKLFIEKFIENEDMEKKEKEKNKDKDKDKGIEEVSNKIQMENNIEKKTSDDMEKIRIQIEKLISIEKEVNKYFVYFSRKFIESYAKIYNDKNINDLINLLEIIKIIRTDKLSYNIAVKLIHDKCLIYSSQGKIKNLNLLSFIENDEILLNDKELQISVDILNFDIEKVNDEFIKKWKKIKWFEIFNNQEEQLYKKICDSIKEMKYFGKLFSLLDLFQKEKDYNDKCLLIMKNTYISLIDTYSKEKCPNCIEDTSSLLYYLNVKNIQISSFIKEYISNVFDVKEMHSIFYNIYSNNKYNIFNDELKGIIFEFYKNKDNHMFIDPLYLGFYIKYNEHLNEDDIFLLNNYVLQPNDFYNLKEVNNYKLLKTIIESKILDNQQIANYIEFSRGTATVIFDEIINGKIDYVLIEKFYYNKKEKEFLDRIKLISQLLQNENIKNNVNHCQEIIKESINNIHQIMDGLQIVQKKLKFFYPNARKDDISNIDELLRNIRSKELFYYKKKEVKEKCDYYLNQKELNSLNLDYKKGNIFFRIFYEEKKKIYKNNDILIMKETEKEINNLINTLKGNTIKNINLNYLCTMLNKLNKEEKNNLGDEIDKLISQYEINTIIDKKKLVNEFLLVSKKNLIYNSVDDFISFIEMTEVEQEEFTQMNKTIVKYLKDPKDINVIELSLELLKNYDIEFKEGTNYQYLKILDMIKNKKNIIQFVINTTLQQIEKLIDYFDKNKWDKGDLPCLLECKKFFNKYFDKNSKDKEIIRSFINGISQSETFEVNLQKLIDNFESIYNMANLGVV